MSFRFLLPISLLCAALALSGLAAPSAQCRETTADAFAQGRVVDSVGAVLAPRDRVVPENRMLQERLDTLLPQLMKEADLDLWLVIAREYAEDPVYFTDKYAGSDTVLVADVPYEPHPCSELTPEFRPNDNR
jgi:hypothetical protein